VPGAIVMMLLVTLSGLAFGGIGAAVALRTGRASVVQGLFPLVFVILFLSSAFFPQDLLTGPAATIAQYNPLSFIVEGIRDPVISSLTWEVFGKAIASLVLVFAIGIALSSMALRRRIRMGG
jgi:ABC-2 type transport system permease protein